MATQESSDYGRVRGGQYDQDRAAKAFALQQEERRAEQRRLGKIEYDRQQALIANQIGFEGRYGASDQPYGFGHPVRPGSTFPSDIIGGDVFQDYGWIPRDAQPDIPVTRWTNISGEWELSNDQNSLYTYTYGDGGMLWNSYSSETKARLEGQLIQSGDLTDGGFTPGASDKVQHDAWENVLFYANYYGITPFNAIGRMATQGDQRTRGGGGGGGGGPKYAVPLSYRTIPDYKALAQEARGIFRGGMGRDMEDWELSILGDSLKSSYVNYNDQMIEAHKAAWDDAVSGGTVDVDYIEVETPGATLAFDIEEDYAGEIDRTQRVYESAASRRVMMESISTGARMAGG